MNPYTFNVELYHQKSTTKPDPRDLLVPESRASSSQNSFSATKLLGKLATGKIGLVAVGGMIAIGCSVRFLRNRRQRFREERTSKQGDKTIISRSDRHTQTEPLPDPVTAEQNIHVVCEEKASGMVDMNEALTPNIPKRAIPGNDFVTEACVATGIDRNLSNVTSRSDSFTTPQCNCASQKGEEGAGRAKPPPHSFCNLSAFLALLALHKALMCDRDATRFRSINKDHLSETSCEQQTVCDSLFNRGRGSTDKSRWQPGRSPILNSSHDSREKTIPAIRPSEIPCSECPLESTTSNEPTSTPKIPTPTQARPSAKAFGDHGSSIGSSASRQEKKGGHLTKDDFSVPPEIPMNNNSGPGKGSFTSSARPSNRRSSSQDVRNNVHPTPSAAVSRTTERRSTKQKGPAGYRSRAHSDSGSASRRGKPRRRGAGRRNIPQRSYVDLDNPKSIAS